MSKSDYQKGREEIIGKMYEFARQHLEEPDWGQSPSDKWKGTGKRELLSELFRYLKELRKEDDEKRD